MLVLRQVVLKLVIVQRQPPRSWDSIPGDMGYNDLSKPLLPVWIPPTMQTAQITLAPREKNVNNVVHPALQTLLPRVLGLRTQSR